MIVGGGGSDFANARLTQLVDEALCNNAECLLWVPPSLPYYPLAGAYADSAGFSKTLVFSAWLMVPRMLASLLSYEVERRTIGNPASVDPQEQEPRLYFAPDKKRHPVQQLVYRMDSEEPSNMTNFTLLYPSLTLAALFDPVAARLSGKSQAILEDELQSQVAALVEKLQLRRYEQADGEPDRWYWAGPVLLDKLSDHHSSVADEWLHSEEIDITSFSTDEDARDTSKGQHFDRLVEAFDSPRRIGLGPMPGDFPRVMAEMALGSPAVTALRSCSRLYGGKTWAKCVSALSVANEFVNLFNKPESVAAVRIAVRERLQYWRKVLWYCRDGCLQAVLDEYLHLLKAECETVPEAVKRLNGSINIRTVPLKVDDLQSFLRDQRKNMRCHFAVDFGNQRIETEEGRNRVANVRQNFNSPFRPFVLATTSIGQEGLDFHQYCRKVVHWNLPSNPIDLEQREGRINRFKGLVIRQQIAHKYGPLLTPDVVRSIDLWDDLFRIAEFMERDGRPYCQLVPFWHVETTEANSFKIERIIPFYRFSRDRAKLWSILRTLAIYRLAFGQPRQSELIEHLLKHLPEDKIGAVREKLMVNLSPISYRPNGSHGEQNLGAAVQVRAVAKGDGESPSSPAQQPKHGSSVTTGLGIKFVWIPPGTFTMGSSREEADRVNNETPHKVTLTKGFHLGVHLVTQQQWQAVMGNNPSRFKGEKNLPVEGVSWEDCHEFIRKVREKENRQYRLPTEAEWEYACRAGTKTPFHVGFQLFPGQANFLGRQTTLIGSFRPNALGLHDMHGNLYEWCEDWYGEYPENAVVDPQGPPVGTERVVRGGCWGLGPGGCRSAYRRHFEAIRRSDCFGFRLVLCSE
jgi:formylglycine-generating enzyme required for sulfatase activity